MRKFRNVEQISGCRVQGQSGRESVYKRATGSPCGDETVQYLGCGGR